MCYHLDDWSTTDRMIGGVQLCCGAAPGSAATSSMTAVDWWSWTGSGRMWYLSAGCWTMWSRVRPGSLEQSCKKAMTTSLYCLADTGFTNLQMESLCGWGLSEDVAAGDFLSSLWRSVTTESCLYPQLTLAPRNIDQHLRVPSQLYVFIYLLILS